MEISGAGITQAALRGVEGADDKRAQFQMLLLKKSLEEQQRQANDFVRLLEGKGNTIDIRV